ncbi:hypothetical protein SAMN05216371_3848 [Streptomyces sp. TLI_053]|uniref:hypothetical protein n=1 Tax=Streptomyces sp. TLI_053 TaxID=1855352 RepID=UPI00087DCE92|nr:hypothetical protein [Streptomyces sp. TLI_053]SDT69727.1 hypothetical protein SAMN05216371_3848 [Streptomyces sp. TLI_053]
MTITTLPIHPRTGLQAVGLRSDGRPIWPILGGSGDPGPGGAPTGEPTTPPVPGPTEPTGTPAPAPVASPAAPPAPAGPTAEQLVEAQQQATEAAAQRDQLQAALDAINKAINPDAGTGADSDPAQLAAAVADRDRQLAELGAQLRTARVELAAHQAAEAAGARPDRLLNSRSFAAAVASLDPTDAKFSEKLTAAITAAVEADPELYRATGAPPARSGGEFRGAPTTRTEPASLLEAISARLAK